MLQNLAANTLKRRLANIANLTSSSSVQVKALDAAQNLHELNKEFPNISIAILEQNAKPGGFATSERDEKSFLWDMGGHVVFSHCEYFDETLDRAVKDWDRRQRDAYAFMKGSDGNRRFVPHPVQNNIEVMDKVDQLKCLSGLEEIAVQTLQILTSGFFATLVTVFARYS